MATGAHAAERIAKATGALPATVFRAARIMREADPSLWPEAGKGGGRGAAHVEPSHLINLILALAIADPITAAPAMVASYRMFVYPGLQYVQRKHMGQTARMLFGTPSPSEQPDPVSAVGVFGGKGGLGADLEQLVELLAGPWRDALEMLQKSGLTVELEMASRFPQALVSYFSLDLPIDIAGHRQELRYVPGQNTLGLRYAAEAPIVRKAILPVSLFGVLAELWADTRSHNASKVKHPPPAEINHEARVFWERENRKQTARQRQQLAAFALRTPNAPDSVIPDSETAESPPGRGDAAVLSDQPHETELDRRSQQPHPTGEREKSQPSSDLWTGHSPQQWSDPNDEPGTGGGADGAAP